RSDQNGGGRQVTSNRPARRCDERKRAGGLEPCQIPRAVAGNRCRGVEEKRPAHSYTRGGYSKRRSQCWGDAFCRPRLTSDRTASQQRCRDDGRDQSPRLSAPGGRYQRKSIGSKKSRYFLCLATRVESKRLGRSSTEWPSGNPL